MKYASMIFDFLVVAIIGSSLGTAIGLVVVALGLILSAVGAL